jgi:hypothetical protein
VLGGDVSVEAAAEDKAEQDRQRGHEHEAAEGDADDGGDHGRAPGGGFLDGEAREQLGTLGERPADDDRGDRGRAP